MHSGQAVTPPTTESNGDARDRKCRAEHRASCRSASCALRGLHKSFGAQKVLNGIDLTVGSGETLAVLGRSGTGKSVLLKLIIGLAEAGLGIDSHPRAGDHQLRLSKR